ncbi:MAG: CAP domain-containing protein [Isosphaeraceae bacterium]|nr:CAP domain-containing protein [Isosphaeraceae bacterium]
MLHRHHFTGFGLFSAVVLSVLFLNVARSAVAQEPAPVAAQPAAAPVAQPTADPAVQPAAAVVAPQPAVVQYVPAGDPYGFTGWLNSIRAQYGLRPVGYDPNLTNWAAVNNQHQASRGMGHFVMGPARRQNCAMGQFATIGAMWMASPAHQAALLDPTISYIGIAGYGAYWTFNAY